MNAVVNGELPARADADCQAKVTQLILGFTESKGIIVQTARCVSDGTREVLIVD